MCYQEVTVLFEFAWLIKTFLVDGKVEKHRKKIKTGYKIKSLLSIVSRTHLNFQGVRFFFSCIRPRQHLTIVPHLTWSEEKNKEHNLRMFLSMTENKDTSRPVEI